MNPKEKKAPSLIRLINIFQTGFFVLLMLLWLVSLWLIHQSETSQFRQEQQMEIQSKVSEVGRKLDQYQAVLQELMAETLDTVDLFDTDPQRQYFGKNEMRRETDQILTYNAVIDFLFEGKKDGFLMMSHLNGDRSFDLRAWIEEAQAQSFEGYQNGNWGSTLINGVVYLYYISFDPPSGIYVGSLIEATALFNDFLNDSFYPSYFSLTDGDETIFSSGEVISRPDYQYILPITASLRVEGQVKQADSWLLRISSLTVLVLGVVCLLGYTVLARIIYQRYLKPMVGLTKEVAQAEQDPEHMHITRINSTREMDELTGSIDHLLDEVLARRMADYQHQLKEQDMELMMLRSQLRPHFYLNALTTIDAMTYQNRNEDIRRFLQALSVHVRYMLRTDESYITLGEEAKHIEAYLEMQEIRHPGKIVHLINIPEEIEEEELPHLILYTVVENSFKYAFGQEDTLLLMIHAEKTEEGILVRIEDNGSGYPEEILSQFRNGPKAAASGEQKRHIGLRNVQRTLALWYGREDLLRLHNSHMGGAVTEILLPV